MSQTCKTCLHYKPNEGEKFVEDFGLCQRFPPVVFANMEGFSSAEQPAVNDTDRCGEWKAKQ